MKQYLAIDIGGTAVKLGIVDEEGRVLSKTEQSVCFDNYETPILTTVLSAAEQFLTAACPTTSEAPLKRSWKRSSACRPLSPTTPTA